jgi:alginate O-acetyltransferase complex protein AlgI
MLFNSYEFLFLFLPATFFIFLLIRGKGHQGGSLLWLVGASLFFYGWWNPAYLTLLTGSILFNYGLSIVLKKCKSTSAKKINLALGIAGNLSLIAYFKYFNFLIQNINVITEKTFHVDTILLPLAISFFTFQQIAFLVDTYKGQTRGNRFLDYCFFVTFFPQLIAGPIVYSREIFPQITDKKFTKFNFTDIAIGLTIFFLGLFKKVVFADSIAPAANQVFQAAGIGADITFFQAWGGALAYTFQLYFDFSGYSDMAIGLARIFGILLPVNFNSPYKATNIIEFWRRWHMTLGRFMKDYLYISLGGNQNGIAKQFMSLMFIMLLVGLWHGAGWTFVLWGGVHGFLLGVNHIWHNLRRAVGQDISQSTLWGRGLSRSLTFLVVVIGWVLFRAPNLDSAMNMFESMAGFNGFVLPRVLIQLPEPIISTLTGVGVVFEGFGGGQFFETWTWVLVFWLIVWYGPNTQQLLLRYKPILKDRLQKKATESCYFGPVWKPNLNWAFLIGLVGALAVLGMSRVSEFLYFQF